MYKLHLILKYLRKRRIAWVSLIAVMLCTAMVLVVISVMGGWLRMFRESFHGLSGDVIVRGESIAGFPFYQEMIAEIEKLPEVRAAIPVIRTFGLINIQKEIMDGVQVVGYPPDVGRVNAFARSLHLQHVPPDGQVSFALLPGQADENGRIRHGMIVGTGVVGIRRTEFGKEPVRPRRMYDVWASLTLVPMDAEASGVQDIRKSVDYYRIVDDSHTGVHIYDSNTVYIAFAKLQQELGMEATADQPARTREIQIALKAGHDIYAARDRIEQVIDAVAREKRLLDDRSFMLRSKPYTVQTWDQLHALWIGAVEKEKVLVTFLFGIISVVAIFMIGCIFYMIVVEKTRDIGIVKAVGATSQGVAGIFLGYGAAIGLVGSLLGLLLSWLIVHNINYLHMWMGKLMGVQMWDPQVYLFDTIPNTMSPWDAVVIPAVAVVASIVGALLPAIRAAALNPVEALRWE